MITGSGEVIHIHVSIHLIVLTSIVPSRSASLPRTFTTRLTYPPTPPIISEFIISGLIIHKWKENDVYRTALKRAIIGRLDSLSCNGVRDTARYISYTQYSTHQEHIDIVGVGQ